MAVNQPAWKVCDRGHIISYLKESTNSDCEEKEANLCLNASRKHSNSFNFRNKLIWKINHGKPRFMNLCPLSAVNCSFPVCCCIPYTGKLPLRSAQTYSRREMWFCFWSSQFLFCLFLGPKQVHSSTLPRSLNWISNKIFLHQSFIPRNRLPGRKCELLSQS